MTVALNILLTILYRVWIKVKVFPHTYMRQMIVGEGELKYYSEVNESVPSRPYSYRPATLSVLLIL
jgi:hypothetical protein